jgi:hypothetical protein
MPADMDEILGFEVTTSMILNSTRNFELTCESTTDYREYRRELVSEHGTQGIEYLDKNSRRGGALGL